MIKNNKWILVSVVYIKQNKLKNSYNFLVVKQAYDWYSLFLSKYEYKNVFCKFKMNF